MADIKNKNELKRRTELFLDEFSHEEYMINEPFCKETMRMVREFIGHACHLLDCKERQIEKAKRKARAKAIDEFMKQVEFEYDNDACPNVTDWMDYRLSIRELFKIAEELRGAE